MGDNFPSGRIPMVKIDGAKIRQLRESKGLTQLYLATAVEVTTDTISRWENRRQPTIKKENGIRLAEALEVDLEEILDHSDSESTDEEVDAPAELQEPHRFSESFNLAPFRKYAILTAFFLCLLAVFFVWKQRPEPENMSISARRILPLHTVAGQPFPVAIIVNTESDSTNTLILKEILPKSAVFITSIPETSAFESQKGEIKWLRKITGEQTFAYVVKITDVSYAESVFSGTIAVRQTKGAQIGVSGPSKILLNDYHWADTNGDGLISDEEILTVYDTFSEIAGFELDIDQVEEMWLGSSYNWDAQKGKFIVLP